jgi:hypothetical protein
MKVKRKFCDFALILHLPSFECALLLKFFGHTLGGIDEKEFKKGMGRVEILRP